jgi:hypothetical protein
LFDCLDSNIFTDDFLSKNIGTDDFLRSNLGTDDLLRNNICTDDVMGSNIGTDDVIRTRKLLGWLLLSLRLLRREGFKLLAFAIPPTTHVVFVLGFAMTAHAKLVSHLLSPRSASSECIMMVSRAFRRCKAEHGQPGQAGTFIRVF